MKIWRKGGSRENGGGGGNEIHAPCACGWRQLIRTDVTDRCFLQFFFMNELNKLTNVIGKLDKLVHKQNCSHDFFLYFINYNIIIVQVIYINIETKEVVRIGYNGFLFPHSYSGEGIGSTHLGFHMSTHEERGTRYIQYGSLLLFQQYCILYLLTIRIYIIQIQIFHVDFFVK